MNVGIKNGSHDHSSDQENAHTPEQHRRYVNVEIKNGIHNHSSEQKNSEDAHTHGQHGDHGHLTDKETL